MFNHFLTADTILTSINIDFSTGEHYATEVIIWGKGEPGTSLGILKYVLFEIFPHALWKCVKQYPCMLIDILYRSLRRCSQLIVRCIPQVRHTAGQLLFQKLEEEVK